MATLGIKLNDFETAREYLSETNERLNSHNLLKNPFEGKIEQYGKDESYFALIEMKPIYPNPLLFGVLIHAGIFLFTQGSISTIHLVPLFLYIGAFFHTKVFFFLMLKAGLRKKAYAGDIKLLSNNNLVERLSKIARRCY